MVASYNMLHAIHAKCLHFEENLMLKMLAAAALAVLLTACAAPAPETRGATATGEATAAQMGFHGPLHRVKKPDGPN